MILTATPPWFQQLAETPLSERGSALEALVTAEFKTWLLMGDEDRLPLDESYFELGLNSLGATEIQERLTAGLGRSINAASLFNNPTVGNLLAHLRDDVLPDLFTQPAVRDRPRVPVQAPPVKALVRDGDGYSSPKALLDDLLNELYKS